MAPSLPIPRGRRKFARIECKSRDRECTMHTHGLLLLGGVEPNVVYEGRNRVVLAGALVGRNRVVLPHTLALSFSHRKTFRNRPLQPLRAALQPRWPKLETSLRTES